MEIHSDKAPLQGETIFEAAHDGALSLLTPLTIRLVWTLREAGLVGEDDAQRAEICFEEALKNAIMHGNGGSADRSVTVRLFRDGNDWGVQISDEGKGFSPGDIPDPEDPDFPWREEGRGIHLMSHLLNEIAYYEGGRTVVLRNAISKPTSGEGPAPAAGQEGPLNVEQTPEALIVSLNLKGMDEATVTAVFDEVLEAVRTAGGSPVILDLSQVTFLASHAIGCVIRVYKTCVGIGQSFAVTGVNDELGKVFTEMRLDTIFSIYPNPEAAICEMAPVEKH